MRTFIQALAMVAACGVTLAAPAWADLNGPDRAFADMAERTSKSEIQDAQWAAKTGVPDPLRRLAEQIIRQQADAQRDLNKIAEQQNFSLPDLPQVSQQDARNRLKNLHGPALEKAYVDYEIERHQKEIDDFRQELRIGKDPELRQYATHYLPILQDELQSAQSVRATLG